MKEEIQEIVDSDPKDQDCMVEAQLEPKSEGDDDLPQDDQSCVHDDSQLATPYVTSSDSQDVPPDDQSLMQPIVGHHSLSEDLMALPGPSDAQEVRGVEEAAGV